MMQNLVENIYCKKSNYGLQETDHNCSICYCCCDVNIARRMDFEIHAESSGNFQSALVDKTVSRRHHYDYNVIGLSSHLQCYCLENYTHCCHSDCRYNVDVDDYEENVIVNAGDNFHVGCYYEDPVVSLAGHCSVPQILNLRYHHLQCYETNHEFLQDLK